MRAIVAKSYSIILTDIIGISNLLDVISLMRQPITEVIITNDKCYKNNACFEPHY